MPAARAHDPDPEMPHGAGKDGPGKWPTLAETVQQNQAYVWRYLRFLGCDPALADDLTQETFVKVLYRDRDIDPVLSEEWDDAIPARASASMAMAASS